MTQTEHFSPVFTMTLGRNADERGDVFAAAEISQLLSTKFDNPKTTSSTYSSWEINLATIGTLYRPATIALHCAERHARFRSPFIVVKIPFGCLIRPLSTFIETVCAVSKLLNCKMLGHQQQQVAANAEIISCYAAVNKDQAEALKDLLVGAGINVELLRPLLAAELSVRSANCLQVFGATIVADLVMSDETELMATQNFGRKSLAEINTYLAERSLWLGMPIDPEAFLLTVGQVLPQPIKADLTTGIKKNNETRLVFRILADYLAAVFYQQELPTEEPLPQSDEESDEPPEEEQGDSDESEFDTLQRRVRKQVLQILNTKE